MNWWKQFPIILLILGTIVDLTTTSIAYFQSLSNPLKPFLELNPVYRLLGNNYYLFTITNLALITLLIITFYHYDKQISKKMITHYIIFTTILLVGLIRLLVGLQNINYIEQMPMRNIQEAEMAIAHTETQGTNIYIHKLVLPAIVPLSLIIINFIIFQRAYKLKPDS